MYAIFHVPTSNNDGATDLILGGNNYEYKPQYSRLDANYGSVLLNDGNNNFTWQNYGDSGFFVRGEIKYIKKLKDKTGNEFIITAINEKSPKVFKINAK